MAGWIPVVLPLLKQHWDDVPVKMQHHMRMSFQYLCEIAFQIPQHHTFLMRIIQQDARDKVSHQTLLSLIIKS
jgi:hypothetical protein